MYLAKDFVETSEGLVFAVVESGSEQGKVLCFLRYALLNDHWQKLNTEQANDFLAENHPYYLHYSVVKEAHCHAVAIDKITQHHQSKTRLRSLLTDNVRDDIEQDLVTLCHLFKKNRLDLNHVGVTGSILIAAQNQNSDIDLVFYSKTVFNQAREITRNLIDQGECSALSENDWLQSYNRRSCDLSYAEYLWHEQRKFNKALINQRKFDLSFVSVNVQNNALLHYKKLKKIVLKVRVIDDSSSFDYPAVFLVQHHKINAIVSYTATYTGQAKTGEWIEVAGLLEQSSDGQRRIVVGSSREAHGEYIKVSNE